MLDPFDQSRLSLFGLWLALVHCYTNDHPTLGYKKIAGLLRSHGYLVNRKMV